MNIQNLRDCDSVSRIIYPPLILLASLPIFIAISFCKGRANGWFQRQRRGGRDTFAQKLLRWLGAHPLKRRSRC
ncbi:MAG: hypothetical protein ACP5QU_07865, partial [Anaerolineae bacterium]